jgi:soluble cytochrome b562
MKLYGLLLVVLLYAPAGSVLRGEEAVRQPQEETELERSMEKMAGAFRKLKRQVADVSKNAESIQLVATMQAAAVEGLKLVPAKASDVPAADREKFVAEYRKEMRKLIENFEKLEAALKANNNNEAVGLVTEISSIQKAGHREFTRPDELK